MLRSPGQSPEEPEREQEGAQYPLDLAGFVLAAPLLAFGTHS